MIVIQIVTQGLSLW